MAATSVRERPSDVSSNYSTRREEEEWRVKHARNYTLSILFYIALVVTCIFGTQIYELFNH